MAELNFPYGAADEHALTATGAQALTINNAFTVIDGVTVPATGNRTLNLTINDEVKKGALLFVKSKTNGIQTTILGTNITSATITGVAGKTKTQGFVFDGSVFLPMGAAQQID